MTISLGGWPTRLATAMASDTSLVLTHAAKAEGRKKRTGGFARAVPPVVGASL